MKNRLFSILLSISVVAPMVLQANSFWPECGVLGFGAATSLYGLNMIAKSGGKDGNPAKGLLGLCITGGGGVIMAKGPAYVRSKNQGWLAKATTKAIKLDAVYTTERSQLLESMPHLITREKNSCMRFALQVYQFLLKYAPYNMIPLVEIN